MKLSTYNSLQEKGDIFEGRYQRIDTWSDLEELQKQGISTDCVFRGMNEAKYKNYTSVQRYFITNELDKSRVTVSQVLQNEVKELLSENNLLSSYFDSLGVEKNWFLLNSFLQHYGGISPLLDFTKSPLVALYFMQEKATVCAMGGDDIENYCSLYYLKVNEVDTINEMINNSLENITNGYGKYRRKIESVDKGKYPLQYKSAKESLDNIKISIRSLIDTFFSEKMFQSYENLQSFLGDDLVLLLNEKALDLNFDTIDCHRRIVMTTNLNSLAQEGVFVMRVGTDPLEKDKIHCIDIHKSLIPTIREYLKQKNISKEKIFPQEEKIAAKALNQSLLFNVNKV